MTADSKFFGPAPDMVGQAGGARFDAKRVSDQVWILEVRPLVDQPGAKVRGDQVVAVLQWIVSTILGIQPETMTLENTKTFKALMDEQQAKFKRHLSVVPDPDPDGGDAA